MVNLIFENFFRKDKKSNQVVNLLKAIPLFDQLSNSELLFLEKLVHSRQYQTDEPIFQIGETGVGMYLITHGSVRLTDNKNNSILLTNGDFFGELALAEENSRRSVQAVATDETTLVGFFRPDLEEIKQRNPVIGVKILTGLSIILATRLRESIRSLRERS